jgi:hypothetical protein
MKFTAYTSKSWALLLLVIVFAFGYGAYLIWDKLPLFARIIVSALVGIAFISLIFQLFSRKPVVTADERGLSCYRHFYATIEWDDVKDAVRAPRAESGINCDGTRCTRWSFTDAWRPIDVYVSDIEKYSKILSPRVHRFVTTFQGQGLRKDCFRLRIDLTGTNGSSEKLQEVIDFYRSRANQVDSGAQNALVNL